MFLTALLLPGNPVRRASLHRVSLRIRSGIMALAGLALLCGNHANSAQAYETLGMVTGPTTGTYIRIGQDVAKIAAPEGITVDVKTSRGSIDNIRRIMSNENAALGIVQSDVLGYLKRINNSEMQKISDQLRLVFPFYQEEVHVLAGTGIRSLQDLNGKKVAVGEEGSGSWLTAMNLLAISGVQPSEILRLAPADGITAVLKKRVDAAFFVGGKPVQLFRNLDEVGKMESTEAKALLKEVHLLPLNDERLLKEYPKAELTPQDYQFLTETIPTVAVTSLLVSFDFADDKKRYSQSRCQTIGALVGSIRRNMDSLRISGHPKWAEVNPDAELKIWKRDACAVVPTQQAKQPDALERELLNTIRNSHGGESRKQEAKR